MKFNRLLSICFTVVIAFQAQSVLADECSSLQETADIKADLSSKMDAVQALTDFLDLPLEFQPKTLECGPRLL
ncbi:MAG: hypothetical protein RBT63_03240 [Bdellovibrionales bacterium]|jgi:hypothetical protein|nr:hypothetical protein [Bdellovibrionales bacterium]